YGDGSEARLPGLVADLIGKKVDVIWVSDAHAAVVAARATKIIPIVFFGVAFAVEQGLAVSLGRPGRNATGVSFYPTPELVGKKLEFLRQISPKATRVALLHSVEEIQTVSGGVYQEPGLAVDAEARRLNIDLHRYRVKSAADFDSVFGE